MGERIDIYELNMKVKFNQYAIIVLYLAILVVVIGIRRGWYN